MLSGYNNCIWYKEAYVHYVSDNAVEASEACSLRGGLQCYTRPSFFHQWKQVITPYPFTSLMGFSAMLRSAVMEHQLMKIHMASCLKISAIHSSLSFFFWSFSQYITAGKSVRVFQTSCQSSLF